MREDSIIVFLDDDACRVATMYQRMTPKDQNRTFWVQTVEETIDMFNADYLPRLDIVSLDHDLGGQTYVHTAREDCGTEIVRFLEKQSPEKFAHVRFVIHSWNIPAAKRMTERLQRAGYRAMMRPFGT